MLPLAPARFSTITCWPSTAGNALATRRVVASAAPPGELGTMQRMGFDGKVGLEAAWPQPAATGMQVRAASAMSLLGAMGGDGQHGRPPRAVAPEMAGAPVDGEFARLERDFLCVEHQHDLALEHDAEI